MMAKNFNSAIEKILGDDTHPRGHTKLQNPKFTTPQEHIPTDTHLHKPTKPENEPTERLDAMIPRKLKWGLEDLVKETNRTQKRGNKTSMTAEITKAIEKHLQNRKL
jgi:hypothetical protein